MNLELDIAPLMLTVLASLRVGVVLLLLPILGGEAVPAQIRVTLAFAIGFVFVPADVQQVPAIGLDLSTAVVYELGIGALLGGIARLLLVAPLAAGDFVANQMGLRSADEVDPFSNLPASPLGRLYETIVLLIFLGARVHEDLIRVLAASFRAHPVGSFSFPDSRGVVLQSLRDCVEYALLMALPMYGVLMVAVVVLAVLAKAVPQLNIMNFGFALRILSGLLAGSALLPGIARPVQAYIGIFRDRLSAVAMG